MKDTFSGLFAFLFLLSLLALPIGFIKPSWILRRADASRKKALLLVSGLVVLFFILFGLTAPPTTNQKSSVSSAPTSSPELTVSPPPEVKGVTTSTLPISTATATVTPNQSLISAKVIKVIDGDTVNVEVNGKTDSVRMIGIDSPESVDPRKPVQCFAIEASNRLKGLLTGKTILLESDPTQGDKDKYNRLLRYIFLDDKTNINKLMISDGFAHEYTYNLPYKYQQEFKQAETEAREAKRGLWADGACASPTPTPTKTTINTPLPTAVQIQTQPAPANNSGGYTCNCSKTCTQISSCEEAYFQLNQCGCSARDGDKDGVPCESLCR